MSDIKVMGGTIVIIAVLLLFAAVWLGGLLMRESEAIREASGAVGGAFEMVSVEIERKLTGNNVIAYADILKIAAKIGKLLPGVDIKVDTDFKIKRVNIVISKDCVTARYTILATLVEYSYKSPVAVQE